MHDTASTLYKNWCVHGLEAVSNKVIWGYVVMRFIGAKLGLLLDTSDGIISM